MRSIFLFLFCLMMTVSMPIIVQASDDDYITVPHVPRNGIHMKTLKQIETYIHSIDTLKARFSQTAEVYSDDLKGTFYLSRPGKLRFEYDDLNDYIVADGTFIYFYDDEMKSASQALIGSTLAAFLVRDDIELLDASIEIMDLTRDEEKGVLGLTLRQADNPEAGRLTLIFKEKPKLQLDKWLVVDSRGYVTQVELSDIKQGVSFKNEKDGLFTYVDPKILKPSYN